MKKKRIVICADGTWNQRDQEDEVTGKRRPTNVTKIARAVISRAPDDIDQVVFYDNGVGTGNPLDEYTGGALGLGVDENIRELYRHILYNHVDGDELYLFGFSRGAYTVRSLAGFMHHCGLVRKGDDYYVPDMYECYAEGIERDSEEWKRRFTRDNGSLRVRAVRECPPITFLGVWDTVGALRGSENENHQVGLNDSIRTAVHALAIDERRRPFLPSMFETPSNWNGELHQCWFAGVHSGVGGSYTPDGLANEALHWVAAHAQRAGLALDWDYLWNFTPVVTSTLHDSMTTTYRLMGSGKRTIGRLPRDHRGRCQETVHESVLRRMAKARCEYAPENLPSPLPPHMEIVQTPGERPPPTARAQETMRKAEAE